MEDGYTGGAYFDGHGGARRMKEKQRHLTRVEKRLTVSAEEALSALCDVVCTRSFYATTKYAHLSRISEENYMPRADVVRACAYCGTSFTVGRSYGRFECTRHSGSYGKSCYAGAPVHNDDDAPLPSYRSRKENPGEPAWSCCGNTDRDSDGCVHFEHASSSDFDDLFSIQGFPDYDWNNGMGTVLPTWRLPLAFLLFPETAFDVVRTPRLATSLPLELRGTLTKQCGYSIYRLVFRDTDRVRFLTYYNDDKTCCTDRTVHLDYLKEEDYAAFHRRYPMEDAYVRCFLPSLKSYVYVETTKSVLSLPLCIK
jgi:hypothetical protein